MEFLQQIANHIGRPIDTACSLIENILGEPTKRLGDLLGDQISYWQWANRIRILEKARAKLNDRKVPPRELPFDFAIPFLRESGDAGAPELQEWWAEMLASAIEKDELCHVAFVHTLRSMSACDVCFLNALLSTGHAEREGRISAVAEAADVSEQQALVSYYNLEAHGFFTPTGKNLKGFAVCFLRACNAGDGLIDAYLRKQKEIRPAIVLD